MKKARRRFGAILLALFLIPPMIAGARPKVYLNGDRDVPKIAITMDDCWKLAYVEKMLDLCATYNFHMTFFPVGCVIEEEERDIWLRMLSEGHEIGNHTQNHRKLSKLKASQIYAELTNMQKSLNRALGFEYDITLMRPPYGSIGGSAGSSTSKFIEKYGYPYIVKWSVSQIDPEKMLKKVKNGDILLYHSNKKDLDGLAKAIPILLERGFELVTVSELLGLEQSEVKAAQ